MRYVVLVPDGAADYPLDELDGQTPLEAAATPCMDRLAREGAGGLVQMIPAQRHPGSDIGNLEIFGYDSRVHYTGRAPLEAASMGVDLGDDGVAFRMNLIYGEGDVLVDYSAGHIDSEEAAELVGLWRLSWGDRRCASIPEWAIATCWCGSAARKKWRPIRRTTSWASPWPRMSLRVKGLREFAPSWTRLGPILAAAPVNAARSARGERPANAIWLWGSGRALRLPSLSERYGLQGGVISAVDLVRGIGKSAGLEVIEVPGITGYLDTNYEGKAEYALAALQDADFVYVHVEAPDEAGHNGDPQAKVQAIEDFDGRVVGPILAGLESLGDCRVLMTPDHRTPIVRRTHSREPVPFVLWGTGIEADAMQAYSERAAEWGSMQVERGHVLMDYLTERCR